MNIALFVFDSVRKDFFDEYATRLRAIADVELAECRAASSWSVPSHGAMVTGRLPSEIGIHTHQMTYDHVSIEETLFDVSHRCIGASSNMYANHHYGFNSFFDSFHNLHSTNPYPEGIHMGKWLQEEDGGLRRYIRFLRDAVAHEHTIASIKNAYNTKIDDVFERLPMPRPIDEGTDAINNKIKSETESEPWFVFANYMEAHIPHRPILQYNSSLYDAPATWSSYELNTQEITRRRRAGETLSEEQWTNINYFRDMYTAAIDYLDQRVSSTIKQLRKQSNEETMVIVTSDHGENMFLADDELVWGHSSSMSEGLLHVPFLIIGGPDWLQNDPPDFFSHLDLRELISNVLNEKQKWPARDRIPAELIGGGVGMSDENQDFYDRAIRVVYDDPDTKWEWDSLGNRNHEEWDNTVHDLFSEDIGTMKEQERKREEDVMLTDEAQSRLKDLGYV